MNEYSSILRSARETEETLIRDGLTSLASKLSIFSRRYARRPTKSNCSQLMRLVHDFGARVAKRGGGS